MIDCNNYRIQKSTNDEWCREGVHLSMCSEDCPFREPCKDEDEKEERFYPD